MSKDDDLDIKRQKILKLLSDFELFAKSQLKRENKIVADFYDKLSQNKIKRIKGKISYL